MENLGALQPPESTEKYGPFVQALRELCKEHKVQLAPSLYDPLQVWDLDEGEDPFDKDWVVDRTAFNGSQGRTLLNC